VLIYTYEVVQIQSRHFTPRRKAELKNQFHDPAGLTLEKELPVLIHRRLDGNHSWSGHCREEKVRSHQELNPEYPVVYVPKPG
jgi:hypothetical protein